MGQGSPSLGALFSFLQVVGCAMQSQWLGPLFASFGTWEKCLATCFHEGIDCLRLSAAAPADWPCRVDVVALHVFLHLPILREKMHAPGGEVLRWPGPHARLLLCGWNEVTNGLLCARIRVMQNTKRSLNMSIVLIQSAPRELIGSECTEVAEN